MAGKYQRPDTEEDLQKKLKRTGRTEAGLEGGSDVEENRNLSGSTTWETLPDQSGHRQHARQGQAQSPNELTPNQPEKSKEGHHASAPRKPNQDDK